MQQGEGPWITNQLQFNIDVETVDSICHLKCVARRGVKIGSVNFGIGGLEFGNWNLKLEIRS